MSPLVPRVFTKLRVPARVGLDFEFMDSIYDLFKVISLGATGLFGALALLTTYKDAQGKITKWGKIALGGIIVSSFISLGLFIVEKVKAEAASARAQAELKSLLDANTKTLNEISRVVHSIKDVKVSYEILVLDHVNLQTYRDRVDRELFRMPESSGDGFPWIFGSAWEGDTVRTLYFSSEAPVAPDRMTESLAYTILSSPDVELQFFKTPIAPNDLFGSAVGCLENQI